MGITIGTHDISRALSDGTGLSQEEIGLLLAAAALATAAFGLLRFASAVSAAWPFPGARPRVRVAR